MVKYIMLLDKRFIYEAKQSLTYFLDVNYWTPI